MGVKLRYVKGAWWIVVHHNGRRKKKRIGRDRETADRVARALRERLVRGDLRLEPPSDAQTLETYAKRWLTTVRNSLKASTSSFYAANLIRHILPPLGDRQVVSLRRADCRDLVARCRAKGLKVSTVRGIARTLSIHPDAGRRRRAPGGKPRLATRQVPAPR